MIAFLLRRVAYAVPVLLGVAMITLLLFDVASGDPVSIKLGKNPVPGRVVEAVWGFFAVYVMVFMAMLLALLAAGLDIITAFSAVGACINNLGPGLEGVAQTYGDLPGTAKWILCLAMLLGRLEVFTLLVLITPTFWRK